MATASQIVLDQIEGASAEIGVPGVMGIVRTGTLKMTGYTSWSQALVDALGINGVPQPGDAHPADERCLLTRARARGLGSDTIHIDLIYERVPLVTYNKRTFTRPIQTMNLPGTHHQILVGYDNANNWPQAKTLVRAATIVCDIPHQQLTVSKALFGQPLDYLVPVEVEQAVTSVNDRPWMGFERGYWKFDGLNVRAIEPSDDFLVALCFYVDAVFTTQVVHNWSQWSFLKLPNGQYIKVADSDIDDVVAQGYDPNAPSTYGWDSAIGNKGFAVTFPYACKNFYQLFGIQ